MCDFKMIKLEDMDVHWVFFPLVSMLLYLASFYRLNCYKCITDTLQELVNQSKAAPQSPSVPKKPGPPVLSSDPNMLSNEEAGHHVSATQVIY